MDFKSYRRIVPTKVRILTEEDHKQRQGIIPTLEGPKPFAVGDYLAHDAKGEWPIKQATIQKKYVQFTPANETGYATYMHIGARMAAAIAEPFTIDGLSGKAGDYLVLDAEGGWPVDRELFEQTYALSEDIEIISDEL